MTEQIKMDPVRDGSGGKPKLRPLVRLRRTITAGITIIVPLWITVFVLAKLFNWADGFSSPLIRQFVGKLGYPDFHIPGLGFLLTFVILWVVGAFTTNVVGKRVLQNAREALERLPVVRTIYTPVQTLMDTMTSPQKAGFKKVVMVEYPRKGTWALGFLACDVPREGNDGEAYSIFVPTAPNPTTGFILIVSGEEIRNTDLSVEAGFQLMLSGGVAVPPSLTMPADSPDAQPAERGPS